FSTALLHPRYWLTWLGACRRLLEVVAGEQKWCFVRLLITTNRLEVFMTKHDAIRIYKNHQNF
ncbi:hypothetical protein O5537_29125, partial [Escherichia coli]|nr:hypothetical protein [Escherichia coli]